MFGMGHQFIAVIALVIALGFFFHYFNNKNTVAASWSGFAAWVCIGLWIVLYVNQHWATPTGDNTTGQIAGADRQFLNVSPDTLMEFYTDKTALQGDKLLEPYRGKWIEVSGSVSNVTSNEYPKEWILVICKLPKQDDDFPRKGFSAIFSDNEQMALARTLIIGSNVKVVGKIKGADYMSISLDEAEIIPTK